MYHSCSYDYCQYCVFKKGRQADCVERVSTSHPFYLYIITKNRAAYNKHYTKGTLRSVLGNLCLLKFMQVTIVDAICNIQFAKHTLCS